MIERLSTIITAAKVFAYSRLPLRLLCELVALLGLLFYWLWADKGAISFVYNAF